jgi:transcription initiation factor TFIIH subunit 4
MTLSEESSNLRSLEGKLQSVVSANSCRGDTSSFGVPCETRDKNHVDIAFLDAYATKQWETILHFLVGTEMPEAPGLGVLKLLIQSRLMEGDPE